MSRLRVTPAAMVALTALVMMGSGRAQTASPATAPAIRLITLGTTAGPLPRKDRAQSSNLLIVNNTLYLIDAGDNVVRRIVQSGNDFTKVGRVFITHAHNDHTA